jgi:hypothetical protein
MPRKTAVADDDKGVRKAYVRALKSFEDWQEGDSREVKITPRVAVLIVNNYLEELAGWHE